MKFIRNRPAWPREAALVAVAGAGLLGAAVPASAHGFGQRYDLPVPLSLYLTGAAAAVVVSFVIIALFVHRPLAGALPHAPRIAAPGKQWPVATLAGQVLTVAVYALVVAAGWFGNQNSLMNLAPTAVWVIGWVGLVYVSALFGNIWARIHPLAAVFGWSELLWRRLTGRALSTGVHYPDRLGVWPGLILLFAFSWTELVFPYAALPAAIAWLAFGYALVTWTGMALFGRAVWLARGEAFALAFGAFARFAPFGPPRRHDEPASASMTAFVVFLLSSVVFDGTLATPVWARLENIVVGAVAGSETASRMIARTLGLLAVWLLFLGTYLAACAVMQKVAGGWPAAGTLARRFAFTLVPIAIGYHLAHYLSFLLIQGQYVIPLASDPFGFGWNLLGTAGYRVDIAVVGARFDWYCAVGAIVAGHIAAVYLAHRTALATLDSPRRTLASQYPMTALMVAYTVVSLSIVAAPIVETSSGPTLDPAAALVAVPPGALIPEPGTGRLHAVGPSRTARLALTFRALGSTFHDGTRMTAADLLYPYVFAWRWSTRDGGEGAPYDPVVDAVTAFARARLVGVRIVGVDTTSKSTSFGDVTFTRELLIVELYADLATDDPERMAALAPPWSTMPWTVIALMEEAVHRGWAAFSRAEAARRGVEWLDLVRSPTLRAHLAELVDAFARDGYRPVGLEGLVTTEEARARWAALGAFSRAHGHFLVTNGPYRLKDWSPQAVTVEAFRDLRYPLGVGSFDSLPIPRRGFITRIEPADEGLKLSVDIETVMKFQRSYKIVREPLATALATSPLPPVLVCRYLVLAADGRVALAGTGDLATDASFRLGLKGRLAPGDYTVQTAVYVGGNAMNPEIARIPFRVADGS
ncbi:hypothetical protein [Limobrevibacterium gyesilva]|uniref:hypothetical protein n=1 Tax=Limobrevibacterium gyesilva TaxID=2991712 RepID=UPI002225B7C3|nr:hypothetical protein [Limobrevibacterium gyesilva]